MNLLTSSLGFICHQQRLQTNRLQGIRYIKETRSPSPRLLRGNCPNRRGRYDVCTGGAAYVHAYMCLNSQSVLVQRFSSPLSEERGKKFKVQCFRVSSIPFAMKWSSRRSTYIAHVSCEGLNSPIFPWVAIIQLYLSSWKNKNKLLLPLHPSYS